MTVTCSLYIQSLNIRTSAGQSCEVSEGEGGTELDLQLGEVVTGASEAGDDVTDVVPGRDGG